MAEAVIKWGLCRCVGAIGVGATMCVKGGCREVWGFLCGEKWVEEASEMQRL